MPWVRALALAQRLQCLADLLFHRGAHRSVTQVPAILKLTDAKFDRSCPLGILRCKAKRHDIGSGEVLPPRELRWTHVILPTKPFHRLFHPMLAYSRIFSR